MDLNKALSQLDPNNEGHWTSDGLPRVDVVARISGNSVLTRRDINDAAPDFTRDSLQDDARPDLEEDEAPAPIAEGEDQEEKEEVEEKPKVDVKPLASAFIEITDETKLLDEAPMAQILSSEDLCNRALEEVDERCQVLLKDQKDIAAELHNLGNVGRVLTKRIELAKKADPNRTSREIQEVIRRGNEERVKKAKKLQQFLSEGTSAQEVLAAANPVSKLDQSLNARKTGFGHGRPQYPVQE